MFVRDVLVLLYPWESDFKEILDQNWAKMLIKPWRMDYFSFPMMKKIIILIRWFWYITSKANHQNQLYNHAYRVSQSGISEIRFPIETPYLGLHWSRYMMAARLKWTAFLTSWLYRDCNSSLRRSINQDSQTTWTYNTVVPPNSRNF